MQQRRVNKIQDMLQDGDKLGLVRYLNYLRGAGIPICEIFPDMIAAHGGPSKFSIASGLSRPTVFKMMKGRSGLSRKTICRTMAVFGMIPTDHRPKS